MQKTKRNWGLLGWAASWLFLAMLMASEAVHERIQLSRSSVAKAKVVEPIQQHRFNDGVSIPRSDYEFMVKGGVYRGVTYEQLDPDGELVVYQKGNPSRNYVVNYDLSQDLDGMHPKFSYFNNSFMLAVVYAMLGYYCYATGWSARRLLKYQIFFNIGYRDKLDFQETPVSCFCAVVLACAVAVSIHYLSFRLIPFSPMKPLPETMIGFLKWISFLGSVTLVVFSLRWKVVASGIVFSATALLLNPFVLNMACWRLYSDYSLIFIGFVIFATSKLKTPEAQLAEEKESVNVR